MLPVIPESIKNLVAAMRVAPGMVIADFGAGSGFVAIELAKQTGAAGMVYAIDIQEAPLEVIRTEATTQRLFNIKAVQSDLEQPKGSTLASNSCDWIVISNLLFQVPNHQTIVAEAKRIAKPHGKIAVAEWNPAFMPSADHHPLDKQETRALFEQAGFAYVSEFAPDARHFGMIFEK